MISFALMYISLPICDDLTLCRAFDTIYVFSFLGCVCTNVMYNAVVVVIVFSQILDDKHDMEAQQSQFGSVYKEKDFMIFKTQCVHPESVVSSFQTGPGFDNPVPGPRAVKQSPSVLLQPVPCGPGP